MDPAISNSIEEKYSNKFLCFFCLSPENLLGSHETKSKFYQLSLRNISRHLKLPLFHPDGEEKGPIALPSSTVWSICENCSSMADEFNKLYHLMEVTTLRLNWCLEKMQTIMSDAGEGFKEEPLNNSGEDSRKLRAAILDRTKGIACPPQVTLYKDRLNQFHIGGDDIPIGNTMEHKSQSAAFKAEPSTSKVHEDVQMDIKMECDVDDRVLPVRIKTERGTEKINTLAQKKDVEKLKCSFCRAQFQKFHGKDGKIGKLNLRLHEVQYHCDQLFPSHKLDSVTDSQFKKITGDLLFKDLIFDNELHLLCAFCDKKYTSPKATKCDKKTVNVSKMKVHLIESHFQEVEEKLKKIQSNPNVSQELRKKKAREVCECGAYLHNPPSQVTHKRWHCPLTVGSHEQTAVSSFFRRKFRPNFESNFAIVSDTSSAQSKFRCKLCKRTYANRSNATRHWKYFCANGKDSTQPHNAR